jgi:SAM-dependent methyltransferase
MRAKPRCDGNAEWHEERFAGYARGDGSSAAHLRRSLGPGTGWCLDVGCGTGLLFDAITATGRRVVGLDISAGQLKMAAQRTTDLVLADAVRLPFADQSFDTVSATYLHTDVDDIAPVFADVERVLRPGGRFVYIGTHPCFVGPFVELQDEQTTVVHPGYREAGWHEDSPYFTDPGCGRRVGYRHVPLAELLAALIGSGLRLTSLEEPRENDAADTVIPGTLALVATKDLP